MRWLLPLVLVACASSRPVPVSATALSKRVWQTDLDEGHPLVGKIWTVRQTRFVSETELLATLDGHVLLGEKHDNPDHHALQAKVLSALVAKKPLVAFDDEHTEDKFWLPVAEEQAVTFLTMGTPS